MIWFVIVIIAVAFLYFLLARKGESDLSILPELFVVFDLETTGLKPEAHEIIEIGAIRVNRDSDIHDTFEALIQPSKKIPKKITEITGITQEMIDSKAEPLEMVLPQFLEFIGDLPLVSFNAEFDMAFLKAALDKMQGNASLPNRVSCALKMARRAWPGRNSYRLADLAKDGNLSADGTHRALGDCKRTIMIYSAAATILGSTE
jgi:DNA polymerase III subunit epsilon